MPRSMERLIEAGLMLAAISLLNGKSSWIDLEPFKPTPKP